MGLGSGLGAWAFVAWGISAARAEFGHTAWAKKWKRRLDRETPLMFEDWENESETQVMAYLRSSLMKIMPYNDSPQMKMSVLICSSFQALSKGSPQIDFL